MADSVETLEALQEVRSAEPEAPPPEPHDAGDWVWVLYWRPWALGGNPSNGTWESAQGRIVSIARSGLVCHEVSNNGVAPDDAAQPESPLRWTPPDRIFRTRAEAETARQTKKNPN